MDPQLITGIVSAVSAIGAGYAVVLSRKKIKAEAENLIVASANDLVGVVMKQLAYMEDKVKELQNDVSSYRTEVEKAAHNEVSLRKELIKLRNRIVSLENFIKSKGFDPVSIISNGEHQ